VPVTWRTVDPETPVFVDESGRRARAVRGAAITVCALCALWLGGLVVGVSGFARFPSGFPAGPQLIAGVPVARTPGPRSAIRLVARRELASLRVGPTSRTAAAVDAVSRSVCLVGRPAAGPRVTAGRQASDRSRGTAGRGSCVTEFPPTGLHHPRSRLI